MERPREEVSFFNYSYFIIIYPRRKNGRVETFCKGELEGKSRLSHTDNDCRNSGLYSIFCNLLLRGIAAVIKKRSVVFQVFKKYLYLENLCDENFEEIEIF